MAKKLPYFPFYTDDWLSDEKLRLCSLAARGLWTDMLCLMHKSDRRGYLQQANGKPFSLEQIARLSGCSTDEAAHLLQELKDSGAASVSEHGVVYNRRMVRDEQVRQARSQAGSAGGKATGDLLRQIAKQTPSKSEDVAQALSGSGIGSEQQGGCSHPEGEGGVGEGGVAGSSFRVDDPIPSTLYVTDFLTCWLQWKAYLAQHGRAMKPQTVHLQLDLMAKMGPARAVAAMKHSMLNSWFSLHEPREDRKRGGTKNDGQRHRYREPGGEAAGGSD